MFLFAKQTIPNQSNSPPLVFPDVSYAFPKVRERWVREREREAKRGQKNRDRDAWKGWDARSHRQREREKIDPKRPIKRERYR